MVGDIYWKRVIDYNFQDIESQSKRHLNRQHKVRVIGYI